MAAPLLSEWGVSQVQAAKLVDVNDRTMRRYCLVGGCPYPVLATRRAVYGCYAGGGLAILI
jgi:hypothetical protein